MVKHAQKAVLIAATVAFALMFCQPAQAGLTLFTQTFGSATVNSTLPESDLYLVYSGLSLTGLQSGAVQIPSSGTFDFTLSAIDLASATVMGIYHSPSGTTGLSIGLGVPVSDGTPYSSFFPSGPAESTIISDLSSGNTAPLIALVQSNPTLFPLVSPGFTGNSFTIGLTNFSGATNGGSVTLVLSDTPLPPPATAPESATAVLLAAGLGSLGLARRFGRFRSERGR